MSVGNVRCQNKFGRRCCTSGRRKLGCALDLPKRVIHKSTQTVVESTLNPGLSGHLLVFRRRRGNATGTHSNRRKSFLLGELSATQPVRRKKFGGERGGEIHDAPLPRSGLLGGQKLGMKCAGQSRTLTHHVLHACSRSFETVRRCSSSCSACCWPPNRPAGSFAASSRSGVAPARGPRSGNGSHGQRTPYPDV